MCGLRRPCWRIAVRYYDTSALVKQYLQEAGSKLVLELLKSGEIRIVEVIAPDYDGFGPGGLIEDLKLGLGALIKHHSAFKRIAVVSDKDWVAHALHAFAWMVPGELAMFGLNELERAKEWAAG